MGDEPSEFVTVQKQCSLALYDNPPAGSSASAAPVVLLAHGLTLSHAMWESTVETLSSSGFRCITVDARGHGRSVPAGDIRSVPVEMLFQDTLAVLKYLSHGNLDGKSLQVHFVGSSMGGFVGMRLAARYPWLLKSLTCANTSCADELSRRISKLANALVLFQHVPLMKGRLIAKAMQMLTGGSCGSKEFNDVKRIVDSVSSEAAKVARGVCDRAAIWDEAPFARCGNVPIMYIHGEEDSSLPITDARKSAEMLGVPPNRFVAVGKAGHTVPLEMPNLFGKHLLSFLRTVEQHH